MKQRFHGNLKRLFYTLYYANILPDGLDAEHIKAHSAAVGRMLSVQYWPPSRWALARHSSSFIKLGPIAESRLYKIAYLQSFAIW